MSSSSSLSTFAHAAAAAGSASAVCVADITQPIPLSRAAISTSLPSLSKNDLRELIAEMQLELMRDRAAQPPRSTPIASLAKVELQLIMRCCDRVSLIALARCSRTTLAAASSDFTWRCLSPIRVCSSTPQLAHKLSTSLLRHVNVTLWWSIDASLRPFSHPGAPSCMGAADVSDAQLGAVKPLTRLRGIDFSHCAVDSTSLIRLLTDPACAQLTELHTAWEEVSAEVLHTLVAHQPLLQRFNVYVKWTITAGDLALLAQLEHLTELRMRLRTLALYGRPDTWPALLFAPTMQSLRTLKFDFSRIMEPHSHWSDAFANLDPLEHLLQSH